MTKYIGNTPAEKYSNLVQQTFTSPTGTGFTLNHEVATSVDLALFVNNTRQDPTTYTASGTTLTLTEALVSGDTMYCLFYGRATDTVNPPDSSVTLAKMAAGTDGQIITYDASGNPVAVGPGTDGQVLTSTGAGSPPAFEDAGGGGAWGTKTTLTTVSSVTGIEVTGLTKTTKIIFYGTSSADAGLRVQTSANNGSSYDAGGTDYSWCLTEYKADQGGLASRLSSGISYGMVAQKISSQADQNIYAEVTVLNPTLTTGRIKIEVNCSTDGESSPDRLEAWQGFVARNAKAAVNAFKLYTYSGNISGKYIVYELN